MKTRGEALEILRHTYAAVFRVPVETIGEATSLVPVQSPEIQQVIEFSCIAIYSEWPNDKVIILLSYLDKLDQVKYEDFPYVTKRGNFRLVFSRSKATIGLLLDAFQNAGIICGNN